jgi:preprotein translocase subunit SecA
MGELRDDIIKAYEEREEELGEELMRQLERFILLQIIDERWREHLHDMDYLREGIHLRGFAQEDPLVAYKNEAYNMFGALIQAIWEEFARYVFNVEIEIEQEQGGGQMWQPPSGSSSTGPLQYLGGTEADQPSALAAAAAGANGDEFYEEAPPKVEQVVREEPKVGRNDPCPCGSGKKYKKCHGVNAVA